MAWNTMCSINVLSNLKMFFLRIPLFFSCGLCTVQIVLYGIRQNHHPKTLCHHSYGASPQRGFCCRREGDYLNCLFVSSVAWVSEMFLDKTRTRVSEYCSTLI